MYLVVSWYVLKCCFIYVLEEILVCLMIKVCASLMNITSISHTWEVVNQTDSEMQRCMCALLSHKRLMYDNECESSKIYIYIFI